MSGDIPFCQLREILRDQRGRRCTKALSYGLGSNYDPNELQELEDEIERSGGRIPSRLQSWLDELEENFEEGKESELEQLGDDISDEEREKFLARSLRLTGVPRRTRRVEGPKGKERVFWDDLVDRDVCLDPADVLLTLARKPRHVQRRVLTTGWDTPCEVTENDLELLLLLAGWTREDFDEVAEEFRQEELQRLGERVQEDIERQRIFVQGADPLDVALREQTEDQILLDRARTLALIEETAVIQRRRRDGLTEKELPFDREAVIQEKFEELKKHRRQIEEEEGINVAELGTRPTAGATGFVLPTPVERTLYDTWIATSKDPYSTEDSNTGEMKLETLIRDVMEEPDNQVLIDKWKVGFPTEIEQLAIWRDRALDYFITQVRNVVLNGQRFPHLEPDDWYDLYGEFPFSLIDVFVPFWPWVAMRDLLNALRKGNTPQQIKQSFKEKFDNNLSQRRVRAYLHHLYHLHRRHGEIDFQDLEFLPDAWVPILGAIKKPSSFLKNWLAHIDEEDDDGLVKPVSDQEVFDTTKVILAPLKEFNSLKLPFLWDVAVMEDNLFDNRDNLSDALQNQWNQVKQSIRKKLDWSSLPKWWAKKMIGIDEFFNSSTAFNKLAQAMAPSTEGFIELKDYLIDSLSDLKLLLKYAKEEEGLTEEDISSFKDMKSLLELFGEDFIWDDLRDFVAVYNALVEPSQQENSAEWISLINEWKDTLDRTEDLEKLITLVNQGPTITTHQPVPRAKKTASKRPSKKSSARVKVTNKRSATRPRSPSLEEEAEEIRPFSKQASRGRRR